MAQSVNQDDSFDFVQIIQSSPADASDCPDRETSLREVKRIRRQIQNYIYKKKHQEVARAKVAAELNARITTGKVRLIYSIYDRLFDIKDGVISVEEVDEEYCLSDIMPDCSLELIDMKPQARIDQENAGIPTPFIKKTVRWNFDVGEWQSLYTYDLDDREPKKYWIVVFQNEKQREKALAKTRQRMAKVVVPDQVQGEESYYYGNNVGYVEGCSCLEGNPCTEFNKYNCKDWDNRIAVALANS